MILVLVFALNFVVTTLLFTVAELVAMMLGQIPGFSVTTLHGRQFLHWYNWIVIVWGDLVCLSMLNTAIYAISQRKELSIPKEAAIACFAVGIGLTCFWLKFQQPRYLMANAKFWDWGFVAPDARITFAGWVHLVYFAFEISLAIMGTYYLFFLPLKWEFALVRVLLFSSAFLFVIGAIVSEKYSPIRWWFEK